MYSQVWLERGIPTMDSWTFSSSLDTRWRLQSQEEGVSLLAEPLAVPVASSFIAQTRSGLKLPSWLSCLFMG